MGGLAVNSHLRQAWARRIEAVSAGRLYHLADKVDFRLDPRKRPQNNSTLGGDWPEPGIFLTNSPEHWLNGYGYWRPWVVEFDVPSGLDGVKDLGNETFVPATAFGGVRITRVLPLDGYCREEYGEWGWSEGDLGVDYLTEEPIPVEALNRYGLHRGYVSPDARTLDAGWRQRYEQKIKKWRRTRSNALASKTAARRQPIQIKASDGKVCAYCSQPIEGEAKKIRTGKGRVEWTHPGAPEGCPR